jgi:hypothetical protein
MAGMAPIKAKILAESIAVLRINPSRIIIVASYVGEKKAKMKCGAAATGALGIFPDLCKSSAC